MLLHSRRTLLFASLLTSGLTLSAQTLTSATVVGTVTDQSGAAVPGAHIRVRQPETDSNSETIAGSAGDYRFPFLKPGTYEITAEAAGLATTTVRITLSVGQEQSSSLRLCVQSVQQSVEVTTSSGLLQTQNGNQVTSFTQQFIQNTPVNGGEITNIAFSTPGLRLNVGGGNANFNVNGLPFNSVLFTVNGPDIVEPYNLNNKSGASNNTLGSNDVSEAAVITNAYSAQYGREAGAQVNYVSKSGTNQFQGNLVENYNGSFLNANDYFNKLSGTPRARSVANQYAASVGGPIWRDICSSSSTLKAFVMHCPPAASFPYPRLNYRHIFLAVCQLHRGDVSRPACCVQRSARHQPRSTSHEWHSPPAGQQQQSGLRQADVCRHLCQRK